MCICIHPIARMMIPAKNIRCFNPWASSKALKICSRLCEGFTFKAGAFDYNIRKAHTAITEFFIFFRLDGSWFERPPCEEIVTISARFKGVTERLGTMDSTKLYAFGRSMMGLTVGMKP